MQYHIMVRSVIYYGRKSPPLTTADCKAFLNCALRQMVATAMCLQHLGAERNERYHVLVLLSLMGFSP